MSASPAGLTVGPAVSRSSAVPAWAVQGPLKWQEVGLRPPKAVTKAPAAYRSAEDVLGRFLDDCCTVDEGAAASCEPYATCKQWCGDAGERQLSPKKLGTLLEERGFQSRRTSKNQLRRGLELRPPTTKDAESLG